MRSSGNNCSDILEEDSNISGYSNSNRLLTPVDLVVSATLDAGSVSSPSTTVVSTVDSACQTCCPVDVGVAEPAAVAPLLFLAGAASQPTLQQQLPQDNDGLNNDTEQDEVVNMQLYQALNEDDKDSGNGSVNELNALLGDESSSSPSVLLLTPLRISEVKKRVEMVEAAAAAAAASASSAESMC